MKLILVAPSVAYVSGLKFQASTGANPIRKVVTMLQNVQKKVEAEAVAEEKLFKKYMCYCKTAGGDLEKSIGESTAKVPQLQSEIESAIASKAQLEQDLEKHQADRAAAKTAIADATALREKEAATFAKLKKEADSNIDAMQRAIAALEKGAGGAFLQSRAAISLRNFFKSIEMDDDDKEQIVAFLDSSHTSDYSPQSGQITGILKQALEEAAADLAAAAKAEQEGIASYESLLTAKKKEVAACTAAIESKTLRVGEVAVSIAQMKNDLSDSEASLIEDKKFLEDLGKNCATKQEEWDGIVKNRAAEQVALSDTIKILNSDDALELFKKALPGAASSFVQLQTTAQSTRISALDAIRAAEQKSGANPYLNFVALALHGKKIGFDKVIKLIDDMVVLLTTEQTDDDNKKEYCGIQFDKMDDKKKSLDTAVANAEKGIEDGQESLAALTSEIDELTAGIKALDKNVAEATEQRKEENADFTALLAQDTAAVELLGLAKNRLNKFYNPKLPQFAQMNDAPPPPPEAPGAYKKKGEESNGVIAMLDALVADLDKEMTVAKGEEKGAQAAYEKAMADAAKKRASDSKSIADKTSNKADTEAAIQALTAEKKENAKELAATIEVISGLHGECDWLIKYFDVRKEARANEIDGLKKAKAVLSGADFS